MQTLLQVVLRAWREADRVARERPEGSRERDAALAAADRLKTLYTELVAAAKADHDTAALARVNAMSTPADAGARSGARITTPDE